MFSTTADGTGQDRSVRASFIVSLLFCLFVFLFVAKLQQEVLREAEFYALEALTDLIRLRLRALSSEERDLPTCDKDYKIVDGIPDGQVTVRAAPFDFARTF